jgi:hypothetical protein
MRGFIFYTLCYHFCAPSFALYSFNESCNSTSFFLFASAFKKLPDDVVQYLLKNETAMKQVLLHHVVPAAWYSVGLMDEMTLPAADGNSLTVRISAGQSRNNSICLLQARVLFELLIPTFIHRPKMGTWSFSRVRSFA